MATSAVIVGELQPPILVGLEAVVVKCVELVLLEFQCFRLPLHFLAVDPGSLKPFLISQLLEALPTLRVWCSIFSLIAQYHADQRSLLLLCQAVDVKSERILSVRGFK